MGYENNVLVKKSTPERNMRSQTHSVHFLDIKTRQFTKPLWNSKRIPISIPNFNFHQDVEVAAWDKRGISAYLGLNDGSIHHFMYFPLTGKEKGKEMYSLTTTSSRFPDYQPMRGRDRQNEEDKVINGLRRIRGLVQQRGERRVPVMYDASFVGLFDTQSGCLLNGSRISSATNYKDKVCIVPLPKEYTKKSFDAEKAGCLVDAFTGEVVIKDLTPFDGSGYKQADYFIHDGLVYISHGNHPEQRITVKEIASGEQVACSSILDSYGFVEWKGLVYDMRNGTTQSDGLQIIRSIKEHAEPLFSVPKGFMFNGMVSTKNHGILISLYNQSGNMSQIVSHLAPDKPIVQETGLVKILVA